MTTHRSDNGGYEEWRDRSQENPTEIEAEEANIGSYIKLRRQHRLRRQRCRTGHGHDGHADAARR